MHAGEWGLGGGNAPLSVIKAMGGGVVYPRVSSEPGGGGGGGRYI